MREKIPGGTAFIARAVGQGQRVAAETCEGCSESVEIPADASVEQRQFVHFKRSKAAGDRALSVGNDRLIKAGVGQPRAGDGQHVARGPKDAPVIYEVGAGVLPLVTEWRRSADGDRHRGCSTGINDGQRRNICDDLRRSADNGDGINRTGRRAECVGNHDIVSMAIVGRDGHIAQRETRIGLAGQWPAESVVVPLISEGGRTVGGRRQRDCGAFGHRHIGRAGWRQHRRRNASREVVVLHLRGGERIIVDRHFVDGADKIHVVHRSRARLPRANRHG